MLAAYQRCTEHGDHHDGPLGDDEGAQQRRDQSVDAEVQDSRSSGHEHRLRYRAAHLDHLVALATATNAMIGGRAARQRVTSNTNTIDRPGATRRRIVANRRKLASTSEGEW